MDSAHIKLLDLAERRLAWTDKRQSLLAANIANVGTPAFQPRDVRPFAQALSRASGVDPTRTSPAHFGRQSGEAPGFPEESRSKVRGIDKNGVSMDEQLMKVAETQTMQSLVAGIYKKYMGMFSIALGKGG